MVVTLARILAVAVLLLAACTTAGEDRPATGCARAVPGDFDGDGHADVVVGDTQEWQGGPGAVYLLSAGKVVPLPSPDRSAMGLGESVALARVDGDGCADVIVGAPYTEVDGKPGAGAVYILYGGAARPAQRVVSPSPQAGAGFGESLAAYGDLVAVGAPHQDVRGVPAAGAVHLVRNGAVQRTITQDTEGVPGSGEPMDRFGTSVALGPSGLVVGTPYERKDGAGRQSGQGPQAGAVTVLRDIMAKAPKGVRVQQDGCRHFGETVAYAGSIGFAAGASSCGQVRLYDPAGNPLRAVKRTADLTLLAGSPDGRFATLWSDSSLRILPGKTLTWRQAEPWSLAMNGDRLAVGTPTARPGGAVTVMDLGTGKSQTFRAPEGVQFGDAVAT